eukprot:gene9267-1354_t
MQHFSGEIPEDLVIKILTYLSFHEYPNFLLTSKLFYSSFYKSPFCINFKLRIFIQKNLSHYKKSTQFKMMEEMKNLLELEQSKISAKQKEKQFWRKWGDKYEPGVFQIKSPYSTETLQEIEEIMKSFQFLTFKKIEIQGGQEIHSKVKLKGVSLIFYHSYLKNYPRSYFWSVKKDEENDNLIISFFMNEDSINGNSDINIDELKQEWNFKGSKNELIDLLNDIAELVVEFPCSDYSSSKNIQY